MDVDTFKPILQAYTGFFSMIRDLTIYACPYSILCKLTIVPVKMKVFIEGIGCISYMFPSLINFKSGNINSHFF